VVVVRAAKGKGKKEQSVYSNTVNLPDTKFDMRANAVVKEPAMQKYWADSQIYEKLAEDNPGEVTAHPAPVVWHHFCIARPAYLPACCSSSPEGAHHATKRRGRRV
jgi:hypothetical protein